MKDLTRRPRSRHGFTLVELMIAVTIFGMLAGAVASTTIVTSRMIYRNMAEADVNQSVRFMEAQLGRDVRAARRMTLGSGGMLTLRTPTGDVDYYLEKNQGRLTLVRRDQSGGSTRTMLGDISNVTFTIPEHSINQLHVQVDAYVKVGGGKDVERTFNSQFTSRVTNFYRF